MPTAHGQFASLVIPAFFVSLFLCLAPSNAAAQSEPAAEAAHSTVPSEIGKQPAGSAKSSTISVRELRIPESARRAFEKGRRLLVDEHRAEGSVVTLRNAVRIFPAYWEAHLLLGVAYMDLRRWSDAELSLRRAVATSERLGAAYLALGSCLLEEGKYPEAEERLLQGLDLEPDAAHGHYDLSRTYYALGRFDDARVQARKAIDFGPADADAHFLLGNILFRLGEKQQALAEFQGCLHLSPGAPLEALARDEVKRLQSQQTSHQ